MCFSELNYAGCHQEDSLSGVNYENNELDLEGDNYIKVASSICIYLLPSKNPCIKEFCSVIYLKSLTTVLISTYQS